MKVLNPYIFIGLGGSGGKTLQYLHYYLDQRLKRAGWEGGMPKAWQFLWFDVPPEPEQLIGDSGIPPLPIENYFSFTSAQVDSLYQIDDALRVNDQAEKTMMGWAPSPGAGAPPIKKGAGQFRGVGRMITLSQYSDIQEKLIAAFNKINDSEVEEELKKLTAHINGKKPSELQGIEVPDPTPILISSLAGGCGAGTFLDVADILKTVDPGAEWANGSYAFLYTPDVFHKINADGLHPNALAAISELLSGTYSDFEDTQSYNYLVSQLGYKPQATTRGPKYPILIGRSNGEIDFDEQENVYKTTSRALMGIALSTSVQQQLSNFIEANMTDGNIKSQDKTGLYDVEGKVFSPKVLSLGYSSVSLGRDYFTDYCVERFTTKVLDRISEHHITAEVLNQVKTERQSIDELASRYFGEFISKLGLNELGEGKENDQIIEALFPEKERKGMTVEAVNRIQSSANQNVDSGPVEGAEWFQRYKNATPANLKKFEEDSREKIIENTRKWTSKIESNILAVISSFLGRVGGQVTSKMIELLVEELSKIQEELEFEAGEKQRAYNAWEQAYSATLSGQSGKFDATDEIFKDVKKNLAYKLIGFPDYEVRVIAQDLVEDIRVNLVSKVQIHVEELTFNSTRDGRKRFNADSWASENNNPSRLHGADNEFFVDNPDKFPEVYEEYLIQNAGDGADNKLGAAENLSIEEYLSEFVKGVGVLINSDTPWVPSNQEFRSNYNDMASTGTYISVSDPYKFIERTRKWFEQKENIFKNYLNQSLTDYLLAKGQNASERLSRSDDVASKISSAIDTSRPLIKIFNNGSQLVHENTVELDKFNNFYTQLPIKGDDLKEIQDATLKIYQQKMEEEFLSSTNKEETFFQDQNASINQIEFFSILRQPMQPFVFESLFRDVVKNWANRNSSHVDITSFWKDRRTRSLSEFLPFPKEIIYGLVRGYFVSTICGEFKDEDDEKLGIKASVGGKDFPFPLIEVIHKRNNLLGVLLETIPLAYSNFAMKVDTKALEGYLTLLNYGKSSDGTLNIDDTASFEFKKDIKKKIKSIGTEQAFDKIKKQKSAYENYFIQIEQKQREDLIRKHTQTYDLKDFIISSIESIIYALENIDTDGTDGDF